MSFIAKNPLTAPIISHQPSSPPIGARGLFASEDGWYDVNSDGVAEKIATNTRVTATENNTRDNQERINKIKYYGNPDIEITPDSYFTFSEDGKTLVSFVNDETNPITEVVIPYNVEIIGNRAFEYCSTLTSIIIPNSVKSIENAAFVGCSSLKDINIPYGVTAINEMVFAGCASLTNVNIPDSVTYIGIDTFNGCNQLTNIVIPSSVTSIDERSFGSCPALSSISILNSIAHIDDTAFSVSDNVTIVCEEGSHVETYAKRNNIPVKYEVVNQTTIDNKIDKIDGKGLSTEDYTTAEKEKLSGLSNYDDTKVKSDIINLATEISDISTKLNGKIDKSAITTEATVFSTDEEIPTAKAAFEAANGVATWLDPRITTTENSINQINEAIMTKTDSAIPETLTANTIYDLGEQTSLTLNLPSGQLGDFIQVDFLSTATPTTLTITATSGLSDYDLIPEANTIYSLYFNWIRLDATTYGWGFGYAEYTRTVA